MERMRTFVAIGCTMNLKRKRRYNVTTWVMMRCDVMSQLLSVLVTECAWTGQKTKGHPCIVTAWCPAENWMTRILHNSVILGSHRGDDEKSLNCVRWHEELKCWGSIDGEIGIGFEPLESWCT
jgi:hypothetical protein